MKRFGPAVFEACFDIRGAPHAAQCVLVSDDGRDCEDGMKFVKGGVHTGETEDEDEY